MASRTCTGMRRRRGRSFCAPRGMAAAAALMAWVLAQAAPVARPDEAFGRLPIWFEPAEWAGPVGEPTFLSRTPGYAVSVTSTEVLLALRGDDAPRHKGRDARPGATRRVAVRIRLLGANPGAPVQGLDPSDARINQIIGSEPALWRQGVPAYARIRSEGVYPGIDVVYYGNQQELEYDFVVGPGANPGIIGLEVTGAEGVFVDGAGDLVLPVGGRELRFLRPVAYQLSDDRRQPVEVRYRIDPGHPECVRFEVGARDADRPLTIDPVLAYGAYLGGTAFDRAWSVVVDGEGGAYVAGETFSRNFPVANAIDPTFNSLVVGLDKPTDVFVARLGPAGTNLVFATYLGGTGDDAAFDLALDSAGNIWLTGATLSTNFPVTPGAISTNIPPANQFGQVYDAFVTQLSADGSALRYSTFLGGAGNDNGLSLAVDSDDSVLVAGFTQSEEDFPVVGVDSEYGGGSSDAFVARLAPDGSQLLYSRFLGGNNQERAESIAVDSLGQAVVAGWTYSGDFPLVQPIQNEFKGGGADGFVAGFSADGAGPRFSTYLGGSEDDKLYGLALDAPGNVYVTGYSFSENFPTNQALVSTNAGEGDVIVAKLDPPGTNLLYSTYLGGSRSEEAWSLVVDGFGGAWVSGYTVSTNFPVFNPIQSAAGGSDDAFVFALNPAGSALDFSTYLGGASVDQALSLARDASGSVYLAGVTYSTNFPGFPSPGTLQSTNAGGGDAFVLKLSNDVVRLQVDVADAGELTLSWPKTLSTYSLESTDAPGGAGDWQAVPETPVGAEDRWTVSLPASAAQRYFRLRR